MKKVFLISCFSVLLFSCLQAQTTYPFNVNPAPGVEERRTYPIDSCIYFMAPADFLIRGTRTVGTSGQEALIVFRSSGGSTDSFSGRASFVIDKADLPDGMSLGENMTGTLFLNAPVEEEENVEWPGGEFTYPSMQIGFLESVGTTKLDSLISVSLQLIQFEFNSLTE